MHRNRADLAQVVLWTITTLVIVWAVLWAVTYPEPSETDASEFLCRSAGSGLTICQHKTTGSCLVLSVGGGLAEVAREVCAADQPEGAMGR